MRQHTVMDWLGEIVGERGRVTEADRRSRVPPASDALPSRSPLPRLAVVVCSAAAGAVVALASSQPPGAGSRALPSVAAAPPAAPDPAEAAAPLAAVAPPVVELAQAAAWTAPDRAGSSDERAGATGPADPRRDPDLEAPFASDRRDAASRNAARFVQRAMELERTGRPFAAIDSYEEALSVEPDAAAIRERLVRLLLASGRAEDAERWSAEALERWPGDPLWLRLRGESLVLQRRAGDAIALVEAAASPLPDAVELHAWVAALHLGRGDGPAARRAYGRIVLHERDDARWWLGLGLALEAEGRGREAAAVYRQALRCPRPLAREARRLLRVRATRLLERGEAS